MASNLGMETELKTEPKYKDWFMNEAKKVGPTYSHSGTHGSSFSVRQKPFFAT